MARVAVDAELVSQVQRETGARTKKAAVEEAMREYLNMCRREALISRFGQGDIDLTPEQLRKMRRPRTFDEAV